MLCLGAQSRRCGATKKPGACIGVPFLYFFGGRGRDKSEIRANEHFISFFFLCADVPVLQRCSTASNWLQGWSYSLRQASFTSPLGFVRSRARDGKAIWEEYF